MGPESAAVAVLPAGESANKGIVESGDAQSPMEVTPCFSQPWERSPAEWML